MRITKTTIAELKFQGANAKARDLRWDDELPGFGIRVWPSGRLTYFVIYRHYGRERYMSLGGAEIMTPAQAREMARNAKLSSRAGKDPLGERRRKAQARTFGDLAAAYRERHLPHRREKTRKMYEALLKRHLAAWETLPLPAIRRAQVSALRDEVGAKHPTTANQLVALVASMFNLATEWGILPEGTPNPAKGVKKFRLEGRSRFVTAAEMPRLVRAIEAEPHLIAQAAIWMFLLTGLRKSEVLRIKWADVDRERREIRVQKTKTRPTTLPLTTHMARILDEMPKLAGNPYVFPDGTGKSHLKEVRYAWVRIRKAAEIEDVRIHDLRHTVASWLVSGGASLALVGRVLNHASPAMTQRYAHFMTQPVATALEGHGDAIQAALVEKPHASPSPDDVLPAS